MSLDHRGGNGQPVMDREEHKHLGNDENQLAGKGVIDIGFYALKVTEVGSVTYVAVAAPGTAQATAKWQVKKIDQTSGVVVTWADGDCNFDNVSTDLTSLTYS